ncbi:hypothetical protein ACFV16_40280 [Streptomyces massasporeus]|uniref:hypothetical protein n=1 Tax=Streptomyces massasporeus TaxID=67324 RepID=UPI0036AD85A8
MHLARPAFAAVSALLALTSLAGMSGSAHATDGNDRSGPGNCTSTILGNNNTNNQTCYITTGHGNTNNHGIGHTNNHSVMLGAVQDAATQAMVTLQNMTSVPLSFRTGSGTFSPNPAPSIPAGSSGSWTATIPVRSEPPASVEYSIDDGTQNGSDFTELIVTSDRGVQRPVETSCVFNTSRGESQSPTNGYSCNVLNPFSLNPVVTLTGSRTAVGQ